MGTVKMIRKSKLVIAMSQAFKSFMYGLPPLSALQAEHEEVERVALSLNDCSHRLMANQVRAMRAASPKLTASLDGVATESGIVINGLEPTSICFDDLQAIRDKLTVNKISLQSDSSKVITNQLTQALIDKQERLIRDTFNHACSDYEINPQEVDIYRIELPNSDLVFCIQVDGIRIDLVKLYGLFHETQGQGSEYYYAKIYCNYEVLYKGKYFE